jgi:hypothetical protein
MDVRDPSQYLHGSACLAQDRNQHQLVTLNLIDPGTLQMPRFGNRGESARFAEIEEQDSQLSEGLVMLDVRCHS